MADSEHGPLHGRLTVTTTASDGIRVITLAGEIDAETAPPCARPLTSRPRPSPASCSTCGT